MNIKLSGIELTYSYKKVLQGVHVEFVAGKIHALLGENGAGKSSLMKILTGFLRPTSGKIFLDEKEVVFKKPEDSLKKNIACVYQRPYLSDSISVLENLRIGIKKFKLKDFASLEFMTGITPDEKAANLSGAQRFFVSLTACLERHPKVLILDEPTALLNEEEGKKLFKKLRVLANEGMNVIIISHKPEDLKYCDDVTRLVEGKIDNGQQSAVISSEKENYFASNKAMSENEQKSISLSPQKCFDLRKNSKGNVAIIPTDRTFLAANPELSITQLLCVHYTESFSPKKRNAFAQEIISRAGINIKPEEKVYNLSGGMLQRLILERELYLNPDIIYLEDPFQGLDSASCERLHERLKQCEEKGSQVVYL